MRFSIRDLMWATALVAVALSWRLDNQTKHAAVQQAHRLHSSLGLAKKWHELAENGYYHRTGAIPASAMPGSSPDWTALDEPLVKP
jgi:hypothetical protein